MSEQGYAGYHSARGNGGYSPHANENSFLYEYYTTAEPSVTIEPPVVGILPDQRETTPSTLHRGSQGGRRHVAATMIRPLGSLPEFPTMLQPHTSNPMPVVFAAPDNTVPITLSLKRGLATIPALSAPNSKNSTPVPIGISTDRQQIADKGEKKEKKEKSKNGQAKKPFHAKWYSVNRVYSDLTYYHKITIPGLVAFLQGEGIDANSEFPAKAKYYLIRTNGSLKKLNRGWAIVQKAKMVHQRVINFKKSGPNTLPDCREGENNDSLLVDTGSTAFGEKDSDNKTAEEAFEGDSADGDFEWDDEPVTLNPVICFRSSMNSPYPGIVSSCGGDQALYTDDNGLDAGALLNQDRSDSSSGMNAGRLRGQDTDAPRANRSVTSSDGSGMSKSQTFGGKSKRPLKSDSDSDGEDVTYVQSNHQQAARSTKMQKTVLSTNGYSTQPANPDFAPCNNTTTTLPPIQPVQQTCGEVSAVRIRIPGEAQASLSGMDSIVVLNMFNGIKRLQEKCMAEIGHMTLQGVQDGICAFAAESSTTPTRQQPTAPEYTVNSEGMAVDSTGEIIISIEVQKLVQMIVSVEARYMNIEALRLREGDMYLLREEQGRINYKDYQLARSALIQRLETDVEWTINHDLRRLEIIEVVEKIWPRLNMIMDNNLALFEGLVPPSPKNLAEHFAAGTGPGYFD